MSKKKSGGKNSDKEQEKKKETNWLNLKPQQLVWKRDWAAQDSVSFRLPFVWAIRPCSVTTTDDNMRVVYKPNRHGTTFTDKVSSRMSHSAKL